MDTDQTVCRAKARDYILDYLGACGPAGMGGIARELHIQLPGVSTREQAERIAAEEVHTLSQSGLIGLYEGTDSYELT